MVSGRLGTALLGVLASLALSALVWYLFGNPFVFLFVPFVPFLFRGRGTDRGPPVRTCEQCGFQTRDPAFEFCPRDGSRLHEATDTEDPTRPEK